MKSQPCTQCQKKTAVLMPVCPECMKASGMGADQRNTAEELRDIARIISITADSDGNIKDALTGILNIAGRLDEERKND